jgi:fructuronate reductase
MAQLSRSNLATLRPGPWKPRDSGEHARSGVLHLGPGAFHRAHQAWYFDRALDQDKRWGISGVSLRSNKVQDLLLPQDGLYTLACLDATTELRVIRAVREVLVADKQAEQVFKRFANPDLQIVTLTVTEKGYCLGSDNQLDLGHEDVQRDIANPAQPRSAIGWLVAGLAYRRAANLPPVTIISCDNQPDNGLRLRSAVLTLAGKLDPELAAWIFDRITFPSSMVDAITPASTDALRTLVADTIGVRDFAAVQREAFSEWVIEDHFAAAAPDFSALGVVLTHDVAAHERAKLRILNGAHSTLAYLGLLRGHSTVLEAMESDELATHVRALISDEILPSLRGDTTLDLTLYAQQTLHRFRNRALRHELAQIAWDGSKKLPYRILDTVRDNLQAGRSISRLATTIAAWLLFLQRAAALDQAIVDPLSDSLLPLARRCNRNTREDVAQFLSASQVFTADLATASSLIDAVHTAAQRLPTRLS